MALVHRVGPSDVGPRGAITLRPADALDEALLVRWRNDQPSQCKVSRADSIALSDEQHALLQGQPDTAIDFF